MTYPRTLVTAPAFEPIELSEAKDHLELTGITAHDTKVGAFIVAARVHTETVCDRALISQTWDVYPQCWPCNGEIKMPLGRLLSVDAFEYTAADGTVTAWTVDGNNLEDADGAVMAHIDTSSDFGGKIVLAYQKTWPTATLKTSNPIRIRITVGYGEDAADVPAPLKAYMMLKIGDMFAHRESTQTGTAQTVVELPFAESLLANFRIR